MGPRANVTIPSHPPSIPVRFVLLLRYRIDPEYMECSVCIESALTHGIQGVFCTRWVSFDSGEEKRFSVLTDPALTQGISVLTTPALTQGTQGIFYMHWTSLDLEITGDLLCALLSQPWHREHKRFFSVCTEPALTQGIQDVFCAHRTNLDSGSPRVFCVHRVSLDSCNTQDFLCSRSQL